MGEKTLNWKDEIVEEVRSRRESYAAQFNYDIQRIVEDLKAKEETRHSGQRADMQPLKPHTEIVNTDDASRS